MFKENDNKDRIFCCESPEEKFQKLADHIKEVLQLDYVFYLLECSDKKRKVAYSTHGVWQKLYPKRMIDNCHLRYTSNNCIYDRKLRSMIIPWLFVKPYGKWQSYTEDARQDYGISNGISWGSGFLGMQESLSIASTQSDPFDFLKLLMRNGDVVMKFRLSLREIVLERMILNGWLSVEKALAITTYVPHPGTIVGNYQADKEYFL